MLITKTIEIDMGHRVPNHKSKCRNPHGHRYKIEVGVDDKVVTARGSSDEGMVIDFSDLKEIMMQEIDAKYDHSFVIYSDDIYGELFSKMRQDGLKIVVVGFIPTAENLAAHWFSCLVGSLLRRRIRLKYVKVWETPTSTATYTDENYEEMPL